MHGAREVFLTRVVDDNEGNRLLRPAKVLPAEEFRAASGGPYSDDVYLCRYEYQKVYQASATPLPTPHTPPRKRGHGHVDMCCASDVRYTY